MLVRCAAIVGLNFTTKLLFEILRHRDMNKMIKTLAELVQSKVFICFQDGKSLRLALQQNPTSTKVDYYSMALQWAMSIRECWACRATSWEPSRVFPHSRNLSVSLCVSLISPSLFLCLSPSLPLFCLSLSSPGKEGRTPKAGERGEAELHYPLLQASDAEDCLRVVAQ